MKNGLIILSLFFISLISNAQVYENGRYNWDKKPVRHTLTAEEEQEKTVILKDTRILEYMYSADQQYLEMLTVTHKIIRVNNDAAVDDNNKVFISMNNVIELVDLKVRSISKTGVITELNKNNIKEVENLENYSAFKIFAVEGVEVGSEIEYFYILKRATKRYGREYVQFSSPNKNVTIKIITPDNITFETKSYNGLPQMKDTVANNRRYLTIENAYAPAMVDEEYSNYERNRMRLEYRLSYNLYNNEGKTKMYTYAEAAQRIYTNTHPVDKADKAVLKLIATIGVNGLSGTEAKVKAIENYVKSNIALIESGDDQYSQIATVLKGKQASEMGIVRLYNRILELSNIKYQLVLTSDRTDMPFDKDFESWDYLESYAYYFPETDKFFAPTHVGMRYPMIPYQFTDNYGLFITGVELGGIKSAISEVKYIPENSYKESYDNMNIDVALNMAEEKVLIDLTRSLGGYVGNPIVAFYEDLNDEDKAKVLKQLAESTIEDAQMKSGIAKNTDRSFCTFTSPLVLSFKMESTALLQSAGNKYILNIGQVIGEQSQLYQEKVRKQPVENDYNRAYMRTITIDTPEGYTFSNLDKIKLFQELKVNGKTSCVFKSDYKMEGNKIIITIEEYYSELHYTLEQFEQFRKVINAAADFNKVAIVLQKK